MSDTTATLDLHTLLEQAGGQHLLGSLASADLNVNLLAFAGVSGVEEHVNREVDVLLAVLDGKGVLTVDGVARPMAAGQATIIPKGAKRSIRSAGDRFAYLTCHVRRGGMMPKIGTSSPEPGRPGF